jgi:hypothetical protein
MSALNDGTRQLIAEADSVEELRRIRDEVTDLINDRIFDLQNE